MTPDAGVTIRLELHAYGQLVLLRGVRLLELSHARLRAHQPLHVMADFMSDDVGL